MRDPPQHNLPTVDKANTYFGEIFIRYPGSESPVSICRHMMFHCLCEFRIIMNRVGSQLFDTTDKPCGLSLENTYDAHDALHSWYLRIPEAFTPPNIALPGHLMLQ